MNSHAVDGHAVDGHAVIRDGAPSPSPLLGVPSAAMARLPTLVPLLQPALLVKGARACRHQRLDALLAWGNKPSAAVAERLAAQRGLPLWRCEDGFLRSLGLGPDTPPLSLLVDDLGVHYDAGGPSRLEQLIQEPLQPDQQRRARALRALWCEQRVSKYNGAPESAAPSEPFVLVVDQTAGDLSIRGGLADAASFRQMLAAARERHPGHRIVVKVHPDVAAGRKRGHFPAGLQGDPAVQLCADGGHPTALLERAVAVYVVSSQLGFEALLWGRPVHCFGMPFYAGWGLTHDLLPPPERRQACRPSLEQLIHACLIAYPRYIDPHRLQPCPPEALIACLGLQRRLRLAGPERIEAFGFKPWKQPILRRFLSGSRLRFRWRHSLPGRHCQAMAIWGAEPGRGVKQRLHQAGSTGLPTPTLLHVEDGFLRSVGLGADLIAPVSWIVDRRGLHYDPTQPSELELLLATHAFTPEQRQRGRKLRQRLVTGAITKYNLPAPTWCRPPDRRRVVLVAGQVESDASIRYGSPVLRTNRELLESVRRSEPQAWIVYKPHPDVVAGLRQGDGDGKTLLTWCDEVIHSGSIAPLFDQVDAVHVLTSLAGFEALLRGVEVHCWGLPFYAGWGLSHDHLPAPRRGRSLQIDELSYGALIHYPRYVSRLSGLFIEAEQAVEELLEWRSEGSSPPGGWRRLFRHWRRWRERIFQNISPGRTG